MYKRYYNKYRELEEEVERGRLSDYASPFVSFTSLNEKSQIDITEWWRQKKIADGEGHKKCPFCGETPAMYERIKYIGGRNHKWSCLWYYYHYVMCKKCLCQTKMCLVRAEYDDADTVYPETYMTDDNIWPLWDNRNEH